MDIGGRIERLMQEMIVQKVGMTQLELAEAAGTTGATVSRILSGNVKGLRPETLKGLAKALHVTVDYLLED